LKELGRLSRMNPAAADYSLTRNYVEWLAVLPWSKTSAGEVDILKAKEILDADHYGLKKVKDRILDYLFGSAFEAGYERGRFFASLGLRVSVRPRWDVRSLGRLIASFRAFRWAVCMMRRRSADNRRTYHRRVAGADHSAPEAG